MLAWWKFNNTIFIQYCAQDYVEEVLFLHVLWRCTFMSMFNFYRITIPIFKGFPSWFNSNMNESPCSIFSIMMTQDVTQDKSWTHWFDHQNLILQMNKEIYSILRLLLVQHFCLFCWFFHYHNLVHDVHENQIKNEIIFVCNKLHWGITLSYYLFILILNLSQTSVPKLFVDLSFLHQFVTCVYLDFFIVELIMNSLNQYLWDDLIISKIIC